MQPILYATAADPGDSVRNAILGQARAALAAFARSHGFLGHHHLCGCGRPSCANDNPETVSLAVLLRAVATEWVQGPDPAGEVLLRERLLAFARTFGLDVCPDGDPECYCVQLDRGDARAVVRTVADVWHGRAGNPGPLGEDETPIDAETIAQMADDHAHNLRVLDAFALFLDPERAPAIRTVVALARAAQGGAWIEEARAMSREALASWLPAPSGEETNGGLAEVRRVLDSALAVAFHADWTTEDARDLAHAAADACAAVLVRGIAHESITDALFAPFAPIISLSDLDAFADTEILAAA